MTLDPHEVQGRIAARIRVPDDARTVDADELLPIAAAARHTGVHRAVPAHRLRAGRTAG